MTHCCLLFDSAVDIREIKEIRPGQKSRDFDRHGDDSSIRVEPAYCFVILYGTEFRLKSLSLAGKKSISISIYFIFISKILYFLFFLLAILLVMLMHNIFTLPWAHSNAKLLFSATSDEEMTMWVKGLGWLVADTLKSPTPLQIER